MIVLRQLGKENLLVSKMGERGVLVDPLDVGSATAIVVIQLL